MLTPVAVASPRYLSPDAPACHPCPWPGLLSIPTPPPYHQRFSIADHLSAARRCAAVAQQHPSWPQSRVRATVAREMNVSTVQLRYMLGKAPSLEPEHAGPDTDALAA